MKKLLLIVPFLTGCAMTAEQSSEWMDTKLENNAAHYVKSKRQICEMSYTETVKLIEGDDLTAWEMYCGAEY